jgi:hypothetical protein
METPNLERSDCWVWRLAVSSSNAEVAAIYQYQHYRSSAAECSILHRLAFRTRRLFVGPQTTRISGNFPIALAVEPGKPEVAVKHKAGNPLAAFCLAPSKAQPATTCQRTTQDRLHVGSTTGDSQTMAELDESFTSSLHIGPTRHLPAHLQKRLCKALACVPLSSRCKISRLSHELWSSQ